MSLSRRSFLSTAAATTALAATADAATASSELQAKASSGTESHQQVPGVYRWSVGKIIVTAIADGYGMLPLGLVPDADPEEAAKLARDAFVPTGDLQCVINTFVVETPSHRVMVDTGFGSGGGAHSGKIWQNLSAAGIDPKNIDALFLSHGHPDHTSGMLKADGAAAFPNAELFVHAKEIAYWSDAGHRSRAPDFQKPWFDGFQQVLAPYRSRTTPIERDDQEIVPGIRARQLFGHTPGHSGLHISDGDKQHLIWTDIIHFPHLQFPRPDWGVAFDVDATAAAKTRRKMLDATSADGMSVSGMHLVFPGFGHVHRDGAKAYAFESGRWQFDL